MLHQKTSLQAVAAPVQTSPVCPPTASAGLWKLRKRQLVTMGMGQNPGTIREPQNSW